MSQERPEREREQRMMDTAGRYQRERNEARQEVLVLRALVRRAAPFVNAVAVMAENKGPSLDWLVEAGIAAGNLAAPSTARRTTRTYWWIRSRSSAKRKVEWATYDWGPETTAGAEELRRLDNAKVGADHQNDGKYAVYFYDGEDAVIRSVGRFDSPADAARAIPFIRAEAVLEATADA